MPQQPDKNGWNSLAEDLDTSTPLTDNNISEWYKKEASKLEERPDFTVWNKLSTKLDTSSVWDKLAVSLDRYELLLWWKNMAFRTSAVLLLLFGSYFSYNNLNNTADLTEKKHLTTSNEYNYGFASLLGAEYNSSKFFSSADVSTINNSKSNYSTPTEKSYTQNQIAQAVNSAKESIK